MSADRAPVRSYQRIFRPDRRIYQIEGHRLPVPGGVPLRWLGYATCALLMVIVLSARSPLISVALAAGAAATGFAFGGRSSSIVAGAASLGASEVIGYVLATVDWPLRLVVLPALLATLATQATPDGRPAHRYARSWIALQLRPERRSLGRPLPGPDAQHGLADQLRVAADAHGPRMPHLRVQGPAILRSEQPLHLIERGRRRPRRSVQGHARRGSRPVLRIDVATGERLEVRP